MPWCVMDFPSREARQFYGRGCRAFTTADRDDSSPAQTQKPPAIVDAAFVAEALKRGAIVWDVRDAAAYQRGHIAGAVNVGDALRVLRNVTTEDFIEIARIEAILGGGGIDPAREIVVYSTRGHVGA